MILYHTSDREIQRPDIHIGRKNADFGWGFYLTPDKAFAHRWARENAVVNEYEFDESGLAIRRFPRNTDWFEYIFHNRRMQDNLTADAVIGPIANDTIFETLGILTNGYLRPDEALRLLMIGPEYIQVAVKTEKAAAQLRWIRSKQIERQDAQALRIERENYQKRFTEEFVKLTETRK